MILNTRDFWIDTLLMIVEPPLIYMGEHRYYERNTQRFEWEIQVPDDYVKGRDKRIGYIEAISRIACGITPWLYLNEKNDYEKHITDRVKDLLICSIENIFDPSLEYYNLWESTEQSMVEAAHLSYAFIRSDLQLYHSLEYETKKRCIETFKKLRKVRMINNNWVLFQAMVETFLNLVGEDGDFFRIEMCLDKVESWYIGDGFYKDGNEFKMDYYNSYVFHSFYYEISKLTKIKNTSLIKNRLFTYSSFLSNLISPTGYYPPIGRSLSYRFGAFHTIGHSLLLGYQNNQVLDKKLIDKLTLVLKFLFVENNPFDKNDFLTLGWQGYDPKIVDYYSNSGSMYSTCLGFLPLAIPEWNPIWR